MYIGVTGFTEPSQVTAALSHVPRATEYKLMVGVLASHKTIRGLPAGNPKRYPRREDIVDLFPVDGRALNLIHYNTSDQSDLAEQFAAALAWGGPNCDGLQLNVVWPDPAALGKFKSKHPEALLVFQLNQGAMVLCKSPDEAADRISREYADLIDYVLIDPSGGKGVPFFPHHACVYLSALEHYRNLRRARYTFGVAGGLCAENLKYALLPVRALMRSFSIDAEGALRTDDVLDNEKVAAYFAAAYRFLTPT